MTAAFDTTAPGIVTARISQCTAHAFLSLATWSGWINASMARRDAAYSIVSREASPTPWQVVLGSWNEQHCYPIAKDFGEMPERPWYMGDIPHGWDLRGIH